MPTDSGGTIPTQMSTMNLAMLTEAKLWARGDRIPIKPTEQAEAQRDGAFLDASVREAAEIFDSEIIALLPGSSGSLEVRAASGAKRELDAKERGVALWVYDQGRSAGLGTKILPGVNVLYVPLAGTEGCVGVLRVHPKIRETPLLPDQMLLLASFARQIGLSLEVSRLQDDARTAQIETEKNDCVIRC